VRSNTSRNWLDQCGLESERSAESFNSFASWNGNTGMEKSITAVVCHAFNTENEVSFPSAFTACMLLLLACTLNKEPSGSLDRVLLRT
jgi:hypothetical protein